MEDITVSDPIMERISNHEFFIQLTRFVHLNQRLRYRDVSLDVWMDVNLQKVNK